jgi:hypothetical protein
VTKKRYCGKQENGLSKKPKPFAHKLCKFSEIFINNMEIASTLTKTNNPKIQKKIRVTQVWDV